MARIPGIDIEEIYAKYELHPSLMDIYVEGEFDKDCLNQFFLQQGLSKSISIITIDCVEIPNSFITDNKLRVGSNKHRLVALSKLLSKRLQNISTNVSCLIDADLDRFLGTILNERHLLYTDFACFEMYFLNEETIRKFLTLVCNLKEVTLEEYLNLLIKIVPTQFCIRAVNEDMELSGTTPPLKKGLANKRELNSFSEAKYVQAFIESNKLHNHAKKIKETFEKLSKQLPKDIRNKCQGHDFVDSLLEFVTHSGKVELQTGSAEAILFGGRLLAGIQDHAHFFSEPLFQKIESVLKNKNSLWTAV